MGAVYEAVDETLERQVALKVLLEHGDSAVNRKRFLREARLAAKLTHPNIATVFEVGEFESHLYIVMELLEGQALRKLLSGQRLNTEQCIELARDIARALARAHVAGITPRDIKPENVFITTPSPNVLTAKVLDFGLARQQRAKPAPVTARNEEHTNTDTTTAPGDILGTPGYWSPEQARSGEVDVRTDIFSFGLVLYEMLTGRQAFKANSTVALVLAVTRHEPEPMRRYVPNIAPELEVLVARCVAKDPAARYADGTELLAAVDEVARVLLRTPQPDLDDVTAADKVPPVEPPPDLPRPRESVPANAPTPGATTLDDWRPKSRPMPPERIRLFAAIVGGFAVAGLLLILATFVWGADRSKVSATALPLAVSAPAASVVVPAATVPAPTVPATTEAPAPEPAPEPVSSVAVVPTPVTSAVSVTPTPLATAGAAATTGAARPVHRDRKADCAQPFTIDAKGVKIPKMHCL